MVGVPLGPENQLVILGNWFDHGEGLSPAVAAAVPEAAALLVAAIRHAVTNGV
jgi:hypothetical protein